MRLGLVLEPSPGAADPLASLTLQATTAEAAGLALGWLEPAADTALLTAAALGVRTSALRLAACVRAGGHPLATAEDAAVADNASNGRIVLVLDDPTGEPGLLAETADVVLAALAPRPFRHAGPRWRIPANLSENDQPEDRIVVRPPVVQSELPVWLTGAAAIARARGLVHVSAAIEPLVAAQADWDETDAALGPAAARLRRPAVRDVGAAPDGSFDEELLITRLRAEQRAWGLDTAVLRLPATLGDAARSAAIGRIASHVGPRVVMDKLPPGLEAHWRAMLPPLSAG